MIDRRRQKRATVPVVSLANNVRDTSDISSTRGAVGDAKHEIERFGRRERLGHGKQHTAATDVDDIGVTPGRVAFRAHTRRQR